MIRFSPTVRISYFHWAIMPIFVNASMWSNWKGIGLCVAAVLDGSELPKEERQTQLATALDLESGGTGDAARLAAYLEKHLPADYKVTSAGSTVNVWWNPTRIVSTTGNLRRRP